MLTSHLRTGRTDMKTLVQDAQDLFREATSATGVKAEELRGRGMELLETEQVRAHDAQIAAVETGKEIATTADDYVHETPWPAVAVAATVGLLVGLLIARK